MEEVLSSSRPNLRDHFEAFLLGQKIGAEENRVRSSDSFESPAELKGSLSRKEVLIKTEIFETDAASNPGFSGVCIKTENPDEGYNISVKTEKLDIDEVGVTCQPTSSAPLSADTIRVKEEKEDAVPIKTEEKDNCNKNESTRCEESHVDNSRDGPLVKRIKTEGHDNCDEFDIKRVKIEKDSDVNTNTVQQVVREFPDSQVKEEVSSSPLGQDNDEAESSGHSPHPLTINEEMDTNDEMEELCGKSTVFEEQNGSHPKGVEHAHHRSSERKAKKLAKMMLKELGENLDFIHGTDEKKTRSKGFISYPLESSAPLRLHEMNNDFVKYKSAYGLQECSVKIQRLSEELLDRYSVNLGELIQEEKIDVETLKMGLYPCSQCDFRSDYSFRLRRHMKSKHADRSYHQCPECDYRAKDPSKIMHHIKSVHRKERPWSCQYCDFKCATKQALNTHKVTHSEDKPHRCSHCGFGAKLIQGLKNHLLTHTGEKRHVCPHCEYRAAHLSSLKSHILTHTGEKPFSCPHCSYRCTQHAHLKSHLHIHSNTKPYACKLCDFKSTQSTHVKTHLKLVHTDYRPYKCRFCSYASKSCANLKTHLRIHTGEKPYACHLCPFRTTQSSPLKSHIQRIHSKA
uniref:C2H2-type domain-containing protein n=1 Tax=Lygus hesperus TaxID=30085 RepID=A0A0A9WBW7_LYGHE